MKEKDSPQNEEKKKSANQEITSLFISKTCKQLLYLNIKNTHNPREGKKLGQRLTWVFLLKRQPGCHRAGEKMLNITSYQREGNRRSKMKPPLVLLRTALIKKTCKKQGCREQRKGDPFYTPGGDVSRCKNDGR